MPVVRILTRDIQHILGRNISGNFFANPLVFHALTYDPQTFEVMGVKTGVGDLTEACTSTRYQPDHENVWRGFGSGVPAYKGGRVVENMYLNSDDLTVNADFAVSSATINNFNTITIDSAGGYAYKRAAGGDIATAGHSYLLRVTVAGGTISTVGLRVDLGATAAITIHPSSVSSDTIYTVGPVTATNNSLSFGIDGRAGFGGGDGVSTGSVNIKNVQWEDVSGRSDTATPSEYIPTTTAAVQKVFANENGNTVASNVVTEATGAILADLPWLYGAPAATNEITYSRDLTTWSTIASANPRYDEIGITGAVNTATKLVSDSAAWDRLTYSHLSAISIGDTFTYRFWVKKDAAPTGYSGIRLASGDGLCEMTIDPKLGILVERNVSPTPLQLTEVIDAGTWWIFHCEFTSVGTVANYTIFLDPVISTTGGSAWAATIGEGAIFGQIELHLNKTISQVRGSSPIFTAGAVDTINTTTLSFDVANHDNAQGLWYCELISVAAAGEVPATQNAIIGGGGAGIMYNQSHNIIRTYDGVGVASSPTVAFIANEPFKVAVGYDAGEGLMWCQKEPGGGRGVDAVYDGEYIIPTAISITAGWDNTTFIRDVRRYAITLSKGKITADGLIS